MGDKESQKVWSYDEIWKNWCERKFRNVRYVAIFLFNIFEGRYTSFTTLLQGKAAPLVREVQMLRHIGQSSMLKDELSRVQRLIVSVLPCRFFDFSMTMTMLFLSPEV